MLTGQDMHNARVSYDEARDIEKMDRDAGRDLRDPEAGARDWISAIRRNRVHAALGIAAGIAAACWMVGWL